MSSIAGKAKRDRIRKKIRSQMQGDKWFESKSPSEQKAIVGGVARDMIRGRETIGAEEEEGIEGKAEPTAEVSPNSGRGVLREEGE